MDRGSCHMVSILVFLDPFATKKNNVRYSRNGHRFNPCFIRPLLQLHLFSIGANERDDVSILVFLDLCATGDLVNATAEIRREFQSLFS